MTKRLPGWANLLPRFLAYKQYRPFEWGINDCCMFSCDWIRTMTGEDIAASLGLRNRYTTAQGAIRILKSFGGLEVLVSRCAEERGWSENSVLYASRGDLGILRTEDGPAVGVVNGVTSVFVGKVAPIHVQTSKLSIVWHIT